MKKLISIALFLVMLLSLTACGGSDSAASTDSGRSAAPAADTVLATEAPDCSHDWTGATCTAPETCLLCGATRGEVTEHSYGKWSARSETEMSRACTVCGEAESAPIDREAMFRELVVGNWDFLSSSGLYGTSDTYSQAPYFQRQLITVTEPERAEYQMSGIESGMNCVYTGYEKQDGSDVYSLRYEFDDGSGSMDALLVHSEEEGDTLSLLMPGLGYTMFSRNDALEQLMPGCYVCGEDYIELHADRSVTGSIGGEVSGYWVLKPVIHSDTGYIFGANVNAQRGSLNDIDYSAADDEIFDALVNADYSLYVSQDTFLIGQSVDELESFDRDKISITFFEDGITFLPAEASNQDSAINDSGVPGVEPGLEDVYSQG